MEDKTNDIPSSRTDDENGNSARELNQSDEESSSVNLVEQQEDNTDCEETEGSAGNEGESEQDPDNSPSPDIDANEPLNAQGKLLPRYITYLYIYKYIYINIYIYMNIFQNERKFPNLRTVML